MRIALINSGLGLLAAAAELHKLRPDADLVLAMDPEGMPWGPRSPQDIADRSLAAARAAAVYRPDVLVFACNTGTVHALGPLRAEFEPDVPVVGTIPAIKPAAAHSGSVAVWATVATTGSAYQRQLIADFAGPARVTAVACPGLADAVDSGHETGIAVAVAHAAARTPADCGAVVLGCTEYELAAEMIAAALPGAVLFGSAAAVAAQALRRTAAGRPAAAPTEAARTEASRTETSGSETSGFRAGTVRVILSGRRAHLPRAALRYPAGRLLAGLVVGPDDDPAYEPVNDSGGEPAGDRPFDRAAGRPVPGSPSTPVTAPPSESVTA
ncbi:MAG TPA: aspartate/glutamate racemase family protein [Streptosporangiaceae bacterium]|jgi:glutamate racemase|nr:aspartate/glutamate racemase family protein [Streptosporangiaceae bacterium]